MPLLTLDNGCLAFGHVALLDKAQFQIDQGERLALIGRNGTGKSSLLKALVGMTSLDDGLIWQQPGLSVAYVAQESDFPGDATVFDAVASGLGEISTLLHDYHVATLEVGAGETAVMERMNALQAQLDAHNGWNLNSRVEQALSRLGLAAETPVKELSGGGKKRVALACALVASPDLLLLDEPTNHLDVDGIVWLEDLLREYPGAVMLITHDRSFLDNVATRVLELDRGQLTSFPGSFGAYQEKKEAMLHAEALANARADKLLAQEEVWIRKGVEARRTRSVGRIKRLEQLRGERSARREQLGKVDFRLARGDESGRLVAEMAHVTKSFGNSVVVRDFSCRIQRGDKIGLIGPNGSGKTTLLRLLLGTIEPDAGTVRQGTRLEVAYFDQFRTALDPDAMLADVISPGSEYVEIAGARQHVVGYLGDFLFAPARARSPVKSLSGGERARLLLARLFARPANVLVLDEPTNDLDIETLELLETLIQDYPGTVFLVSHDRAFLDNVVTQTIASEGDGRWKEYAGGYADWLRQRPAPVTGALATMERTIGARIESPVVLQPATNPVSKAPSVKVKLSFKEQKELDGLPATIEALELEQKSLQDLLATPDYYKRAADQARADQQRLDALESEILAAMARWEALEAKV